MTRDEALRLLGLNVSVTPEALDAALMERVATLEKRRDSAPTEALRDKYAKQLTELEAARTALISPSAIGGITATMMADLPVAEAAYTRSGMASPVTGLAIKEGQVIANRYEIHGQIGSGGMGAVYRAFDRNRAKDIAIKVLLPSMMTSPKARDRFLTEARLSSEMSHPNIVTMFDVQQDGPYYFLTMELLHGESLRDHLNTYKKDRRAMPPAEVLKIVKPVCQALAYAHERTVHRDIKPENIWIGTDGKVKVMDFGIARVTSNTQMTQTMMALGTAYYMAPEQLSGVSEIDGRADQYAVAAMIYEMLSGQVPTGRIDSLRKLRKDVPAALSVAVDKALSPRASERYANITEFEHALERGGFLPGVSPKWLLIGVGSVVGVAVLGFGLWFARGALMGQGAVREEAVRLEAEVKSLQKQIDVQRREVHDAATSSARDVEKMESQYRSARSAEDRLRLWMKHAESEERAATAAEIDRRFKQALDAPDGLTSQEGLMAAAEALLRSGDSAGAVKGFSGVLQSLQTLKVLPENARADLDTTRKNTLAGLEGKWASANHGCDQPTVWVVKDNVLQVAVPGKAVTQERVAQVLSGVVATVSLAEADRGSAYRYEVAGSELTARVLGAGGRQSSFKKCS